MNIQSLSIVVPTKRCVNDCPFCVSKMHDNDYNNSFNVLQYIKRIKYATSNGVNSCIITGTGEPLQNINFLQNIKDVFLKLNHPFPNLEFQTTGVLLLKKDPNQDLYKNLELLDSLGVNTISLSVSNIFDNNENDNVIKIPKHLQFDLQELIAIIKDYGFNVRLSINMINVYDNYINTDIFNRLSELKINQVTFRQLYSGSDNSEESKWVKDNACNIETIKSINNFIKQNGIFLYKLPYGANVYSINGMSVVLDDDCMNKNNNESLKYVIIRENGKLYCQWDDEGSLIF